MGVTDCHTSDIGHWFAMTGDFARGARGIGRRREGTPPYARFENRCNRADVGIGPYAPFTDRSP